MKRIDRTQKVRTGFHEAKWDEPIIYELSKPGERGILPPHAEEKVRKTVGDGVSALPEGLRRKQTVNLRAGFCATICAFRRRRWARM